MMDNLRAAANNVVLKVILAVIIASFVLTGVGDYLIGGSGDYAAKVNGQEISRNQLEQAVKNERNRQQEELGERFSILAGNDGYMQQMRRQVLSELIDKTLLDQYAGTLGLGISDEQIRETIFAVPDFQTNGRFDNDKYLLLVRRLGITPEMYAQMLRKDLLARQLLNGLGGTQFMLPQEVDRLIALEAQDRVIRSATLNIGDRAGAQSVSDEEAQNYYNQNKNDFVAPESFKVSYLTLDVAAIAEKITVSDDEVNHYYEQHKDDLAQAARKKFSVIQVKTESDAQAVLEQLKQGADFAALAKEKSTDAISQRNGGDLGWMEDNSTIDELKQANLTEKGQLSGVIKSSVGYLVARLDDIQPQVLKPLSEMRDEVAEKVKQEKAQDAYYALQQKISEAASNDNESLASAEEVSGLKATETDWFTRQTLPAALNFPAVTKALFEGSLLGSNGAPGSNSDVINVEGDRAFVVRITDHKSESTLPLDQVRDKIVQTLKQQKAQQQARLEAEKILAALKEGKGDDALKAAGLTFGAAQTLSSVSPGSDLSGEVFSLPQPQKDKPSYGLATDRQGNVVLLALDEVKPHTLEDPMKAQITSWIEKNAVGSMFDALLASLRSEAKIKMGSASESQ
ncbi:peptidylprolyl isomerase [Affinibrenneria salicis]|uniref:Periplasmic chaperone PpiD n=1 Tax=Affinibrenneria salicis TaxID=2590031 RepID=A0A5J5G142_9GAMM|nr:peptidylprolyl isomerase [Affinibrenneria salicis]KAA9000064.1 peptidylprolyl isomerase [Affinibrenneria salicis]